jgi:hypothetical protein
MLEEDQQPLFWLQQRVADLGRSCHRGCHGSHPALAEQAHGVAGVGSAGLATPAVIS